MSAEVAVIWRLHQDWKVCFQIHSDASWPEASVTEQVGPSLQHRRAFPRASNPRERAGQQPQHAASVLTRLRYRPSRAQHSVVIQTNTQTMWVGTTKGLNARNPGALWGSPWRLEPGLHGIVSVSSQSKACLSQQYQWDPGRSDWVIGQTRITCPPWDRSGSEEAGLDLSQQVRERFCYLKG